MKLLLHCFIFTVAVISSGCDASVGRAVDVQPSENTREVVIRSHVNAGGRFQISHRLLTEPMVGEPLTVALEFSLQPYRDVEVTFSDSVDYDLSGHTTRVFEGTENGKIDALIDLVPSRAGKSYLKFIATSDDGQSIRSYAIVLKVQGQDGHVPVKEKKKVQRVDLPSSHN